MPTTNPFDRLSAKQKADVLEYIKDNGTRLYHNGGTMEAEKLTAKECVDYYLKWHGMMGYSEMITDVILNAYGVEKNQ